MRSLGEAAIDPNNELGSGAATKSERRMSERVRGGSARARALLRLYPSSRLPSRPWAQFVRSAASPSAGSRRRGQGSAAGPRLHPAPSEPPPAAHARRRRRRRHRHPIPPVTANPPTRPARSPYPLPVLLLVAAQTPGPP
jgi:hypothetical protein